EGEPAALDLERRRIERQCLDQRDVDSRDDLSRLEVNGQQFGLAVGADGAVAAHRITRARLLGEVEEGIELVGGVDEGADLVRGAARNLREDERRGERPYRARRRTGEECAFRNARDRRRGGAGAV